MVPVRTVLLLSMIRLSIGLLRQWSRRAHWLGVDLNPLNLPAIVFEPYTSVKFENQMFHKWNRLDSNPGLQRTMQAR